jgi:hypothetical protein
MALTPLAFPTKLRDPTFGEDEELYAYSLCEENPGLNRAEVQAHARRWFMLWQLGLADSVQDLKAIIARIITGA